ncbi:hypothetical protein BT69DRAFT_1354314 [Atractiella rhizophila]|nr:hypothetical protein BT69DRAFT_1355384 [Atractiella rhizophila]KAH8917961.1 hypothetical protein BT69DRAFT_1354314 [Atractiella rhizophila]
MKLSTIVATALSATLATAKLEITWWTGNDCDQGTYLGTTVVEGQCASVPIGAKWGHTYTSSATKTLQFFGSAGECSGNILWQATVGSTVHCVGTRSDFKSVYGF